MTAKVCSDIEKKKSGLGLDLRLVGQFFDGSSSSKTNLKEKLFLFDLNLSWIDSVSTCDTVKRHKSLGNPYPYPCLYIQNCIRIYIVKIGDQHLEKYPIRLKIKIKITLGIVSFLYKTITTFSRFNTRPNENFTWSRVMQLLDTNCVCVSVFLNFFYNKKIIYFKFITNITLIKLLDRAELAEFIRLPFPTTTSIFLSGGGIGGVLILERFECCERRL
ncbi:hypothetical protein BpHYR1_032021 [Brachionus plicatilis]|uniref:Uncharacterized protein n=1 Tax=Brachionus plicatilis TaxID=10195 RepID=A0A3M7T1N5_BRAPC|nr:hypothetical protein BpHYR1_032021 [Brachionus plicatilis]